MFMPSDTDYLSAVKAGDTAAAQRMVDEAAKASGYNVGPVWHQTSEEARRAIYQEGFRLDKGQARLSDEQVPDAFFFKASPSDIGVGALGADAKQIRVYLKADNILEFPDRAAAERWMLEMDEYRRIKQKIATYDKEQSAEFERRWEVLRAFDTKPGEQSSREQRRALKADLEIEAMLDAWKEELARMAGEARAVITSRLKSEGFDGFRLKNDAGSMKRSVDMTAVFSPSQIKSADPVTYDDAGNVIPLSQRFKATSEDIRYMPASDQDTKAIQMLPKPRRSLDAAYRDGVKTRNQDPQYYDVPDYVGYDMARTAAFEMGREGAEPPRWVMAERIGKLPTEGRSKNFAEDRMERGVSVLRIVGEPQSDAGTYEMFNPGEKRYVAGWLVGLGSDGEPLLADAVDLGSASNDVRMMPSPDSAMPGAYSFPGGYRALPGKTKGSLRLYGPAGSLLGIASSLDEAQRIIRKKAKQ
jgi:hypothetical protein